MKQTVRYGIIAAGWVLYLLIGLCGASDTDNTATTETESSTQIEESVAVEADEDDDVLIYFEKDDVVNQFITDYNNTQATQITDISQGNIKTKAYAYIDDTRILMLDAYGNTADCFEVTIYAGGDSSEEIAAILDVFETVVAVLDDSLETADIATARETLENSMETNVTLDVGSVSVAYYASSANNSPRLELSTSDYANPDN